MRLPISVKSYVQIPSVTALDFNRPHDSLSRYISLYTCNTLTRSNTVSLPILFMNDSAGRLICLLMRIVDGFNNPASLHWTILYSPAYSSLGGWEVIFRDST